MKSAQQLDRREFLATPLGFIAVSWLNMTATSISTLATVANR